ncbi:hypothetical protein TBLA_0J01830 [Henningerozyma blattae CBS 6284]|uniref:RRM domain-containing protein n=1 Tax=Henningerozyma blattae (strain ATCC 34711 / CBS 6284 / DSM 70876 / NBRC 10599 / NRRL Y-10934 / UCD 77-7) TaxID=1071380 RepID=I2H9X5_HENB6|nr:hypothetical protein TBLA_0J01830 [Tetrapisispora blattae CBS 6284]CCH63177.1 hypothetical protein TBLA_0J01830 [Tetrapisispora blattae CBS 6284]
MSQYKKIQQLNDTELQNNILSIEKSWHYNYIDYGYIFIGNLNKNLTEGDILTVFSQFGNPIDLKLIRNKQTNHSMGFAYLKYEDSRSCILAIDNLNGSKVAGNTLKIDHFWHDPNKNKNDEEYYQDYVKLVKEELKRDFI